MKCNKNIVCIHGKNKKICRQCGGSKICIHNKYKNDCNICLGSRICKHLKHKKRCKLCKNENNPLCNHGKNIKYCPECYIPITQNEFNQLINSNYYKKLKNKLFNISSINANSRDISIHFSRLFILEKY